MDVRSGRPSQAAYVPPKTDFTDTVFHRFLKAQTLRGTLSAFFTLCEQIGVKQFEEHRNFYNTIKENVRSWKALQLWEILDKKIKTCQPVYEGSPCANSRILIIGSGPCGLRSAIECALLGAKVVVVEKREDFTRNNVLHLWSYVIADLRNLGAKVCYPKFCPGNIDHISIRKLQFILLKVALLCGVEFHHSISFADLVEPSEENGKGWTACFDPPEHRLSRFEFDVIIGADGRKNTLKGFPKKKAGRALAIAMTFNFVNNRTRQESNAEEIGGIAYFYRKEFFDEMDRKLGIALENLVYYKDETHYFVLTAKKRSLLNKGVLKENKHSAQELLHKSNIDEEKMRAFAVEVAQFSTTLPKFDFELNHHNEADVAVFDFTSVYSAEHAAIIREKNGQKLLACVVGDSLLQPFWPQGTGCARGFLSCFDAAWMIRHWSLGEKSDLEILAEREYLFQKLPSTSPSSLEKDCNSYTINPSTRYVLNNIGETVTIEDVQHLHNPEQHTRVKRKKNFVVSFGSQRPGAPDFSGSESEDNITSCSSSEDESSDQRSDGEDLAGEIKRASVSSYVERYEKKSTDPLQEVQLDERNASISILNVQDGVNGLKEESSEKVKPDEECKSFYRQDTLVQDTNAA